MNNLKPKKFNRLLLFFIMALFVLGPLAAVSFNSEVARANDSHNEEALRSVIEQLLRRIRELEEKLNRQEEGGSIEVVSPSHNDEWVRSPRVTDTLMGNKSYKQNIEWTGAPTNREAIYQQDSEAKVYLEERTSQGNYRTVGRIPPFGYGSIAWVAGVVSDKDCRLPSGEVIEDSCFNKDNMFLVPEGRYYVRVENTDTEEYGRSDTFRIVEEEQSQGFQAERSGDQLVFVEMKPNEEKRVYELTVRAGNSDLDVRRIDFHFTERPSRYFDELNLYYLGKGGSYEVSGISSRSDYHQPGSDHWRARFFTGDVPTVSANQEQTFYLKGKRSDRSSFSNRDTIEMYVPQEGVRARDRDNMVMHHAPDRSLNPTTVKMVSEQDDDPRIEVTRPRSGSRIEADDSVNIAWQAQNVEERADILLAGYSADGSQIGDMFLIDVEVPSDQGSYDWVPSEPALDRKVEEYFPKEPDHYRVGVREIAGKAGTEGIKALSDRFTISGLDYETEVEASFYDGLPSGFTPSLGYYNAGVITLWDEDGERFYSSGKERTGFQSRSRPGLALPEDFKPLTVAYYHELADDPVFGYWNEEGDYYIDIDKESDNDLRKVDLSKATALISSDFQPVTGYWHGFGNGQVELWTEDGYRYNWDSGRDQFEKYSPEILSRTRDDIEDSGLPAGRAPELAYYYDESVDDSGEGMHLWYENGEVYRRRVDRFDGSYYFELTGGWINGLPDDVTPDAGYWDQNEDRIILWYGDQAYRSKEGTDARFEKIER